MAKSSPRLSSRRSPLPAVATTVDSSISSPSAAGRPKRQHAPSTGFVLHKNAAYAAKVEAKRRRWKSLKQILDLPTTIDAIDKDDGEGEGTPAKNGGRSKKRPLTRPVDLSASSVAANGSALSSYRSLDAAPSSLPPRHYCDITGLPARYRDPKTGLWFADKSVFAYARGLSTQRQQQFLQLRNAGVSI